MHLVLVSKKTVNREEDWTRCLCYCKTFVLTAIIKVGETSLTRRRLRGSILQLHLNRSTSLKKLGGKLWESSFNFATKWPEPKRHEIARKLLKLICRNFLLTPSRFPSYKTRFQPEILQKNTFPAKRYPPLSLLKGCPTPEVNSLAAKPTLNHRRTLPAKGLADVQRIRNAPMDLKKLPIPERVRCVEPIAREGLEGRRASAGTTEHRVGGP